MTPVPSSKSPEEAVRLYFQAMWAHQDVSPLAVGPLATVDRLAHLVEADLESRSRGELDHIQIKSMDETDAVVDLDAWSETSYVHPHGEKITQRVSFRGPVHLRQVESDWRIVDYMREGQSVLGGIRILNSAPTVAYDIALRPLATEIRKESFAMFAEVSNRRNATIEILAADYRPRPWVRPRRSGVFGHATVDPRAAETIGFAWDCTLTPAMKRVKPKVHLSLADARVVVLGIEADLRLPS
jgi:hypothetical protein